MLTGIKMSAVKLSHSVMRDEAVMPSACAFQGLVFTFCSLSYYHLYRVLDKLA